MRKSKWDREKEKGKRGCEERTGRSKKIEKKKKEPSERKNKHIYI